MASVTEQYSGIVLNQDQPPASSSDKLLVNDGAWRYQEFFLPSNYKRGEYIPQLSGWQVMAQVTDDAAVTINWKIESKVLGSAWAQIGNGTTTGAHASGNKVWVDLYADNPIDLTQQIIDNRLRIGFQVTSGITNVWYSQPNPFALSFSRAMAADGTTPIQVGGQDLSFCFRVLGLVADSGVDYLGNDYRSVAVISSPHNTNPLSGSKDSYWMSDPSPSRFAVKSLYFDIREVAPTRYIEDPANPGSYIEVTPTINDVARVVDKVLLDPLTPGVYFNIYYSNDGDASATTTEDEWDNKLWTHVPRTYRMTKRESFVLPEPIQAKFIKLEFSHLQAQSYNPGDLPRPITYAKHPKWVLDYFMARTQAQKDANNLLTGRVGIIYDALDLAFNYYLDDLGQEPNKPVEIDPNFSTSVSNFLQNRTDQSDLVDADTLAKINTALAPYQQHPSVFAKSEYLLGDYSKQSAVLTASYPTEVDPSTIDSPDVRELRNEAVIFEADYPVMFFYLTCRHKYREVTASFSHNRAYFVGVREVAFTRENYTVTNDTDMFQDSFGDITNAARNDFTAPAPPDPPPMPSSGPTTAAPAFFKFGVVSETGTGIAPQPVTNGKMHLSAQHVHDNYLQAETPRSNAAIIGPPDHYWMAGDQVFDSTGAREAVHLRKAWAYIDGLGSGSGSASVRVALYQYDGTLWATSDPVTVTAGQAAGWVEFTFPAPYLGATLPSTTATYASAYYSGGAVPWSPMLMGIAVSGGDHVRVWEYPTTMNLIKNPTYLSGDLTNFTATSGTITYTTSSPDVGGPNAMQLVGSGGLAGRAVTDAVDLIPGQSNYSASIEARPHWSTGSTSITCTFSIEWLDNTNTVIHTDSNSAVVSGFGGTPPNTWTIESVSVPAGAVKARLAFSVQNDGTCSAFPQNWQLTPGPLARFDYPGYTLSPVVQFNSALGAFIPRGTSNESLSYGAGTLDLVSGNPPADITNLTPTLSRPAVHIDTTISRMESWVPVDHTVRFDFNGIDMSGSSVEHDQIMSLNETGFVIQNIRVLVYATSTGTNDMAVLGIDLAGPEPSEPVYVGIYDGWNGTQIGTGLADANRTQFRDNADYGYRDEYNAIDQTLSRDVRPRDVIGAFTGQSAVGDYKLYLSTSGTTDIMLNVSVLFDLVHA